MVDGASAVSRCAHNLVRALMLEAAVRAEVPLRRLSLKGSCGALLKVINGPQGPEKPHAQRGAHSRRNAGGHPGKGGTRRMRCLDPEAIPEPGRLLHKAVALAGRQRPSVDPYGARAAAISPSGTFVNKPRVHEQPTVTLNPSPRRPRLT